jgi:hypothetical protein
MSEYTVIARKSFRCEEYQCRQPVEPGEAYARTVAFPGDVNSSNRPWVLKLCSSCYTRYGKTMPPRRSYRRALAPADPDPHTTSDKEQT